MISGKCEINVLDLSDDKLLTKDTLFFDAFARVNNGAAFINHLVVRGNEIYATDEYSNREYSNAIRIGDRKDFFSSNQKIS